MKATSDFNLAHFVELTPDNEEDFELLEAYDRQLETNCTNEQWCRTEFARLAGWIRDAGGPDFTPLLPIWRTPPKSRPKPPRKFRADPHTRPKSREKYRKSLADIHTHVQGWFGAFVTAAALLRELRSASPDAGKAAQLTLWVALLAMGLPASGWRNFMDNPIAKANKRWRDKPKEWEQWLDLAEQIQREKRKPGEKRLSGLAEAELVRLRLAKATPPPKRLPTAGAISKRLSKLRKA
jgi:hypothetical protein